MRFETTGLKGLVIVHQTPIEDDRGQFARIFCSREFADQGLADQFVQENRSVCKYAGTLRGLHYQLPPHAEAKLVRCTRGSVLDVAVDCRQGSSTFLKSFSIELSDDNGKLLYVPPGFAHGYQALSDGAEVSYLASASYQGDAERQIKFDDPRIGIAWPISPPILSPKDSATPWLIDGFDGVSGIDELENDQIGTGESNE